MHSSTLALAVIAVIIAAVLIDKDLGTIALAAGLLYLAAELWNRERRAGGFTAGLPGELSHDPPSDELLPPLCGVPPPLCGMPPPLCGAPPVEAYPPEQYLGAIDIDSTETFDSADTSWAGGYRDRREKDNGCVPVGNPIVTGRTFAPAGAPACFDDEANGEEFDADERNVYFARSRNDPLRPTIGIMNRLRDFDPYVREELEEEEDRPWWGRHEI